MRRHSGSRQLHTTGRGWLPVSVSRGAWTRAVPGILCQSHPNNKARGGSSGSSGGATTATERDPWRTHTHHSSSSMQPSSSRSRPAPNPTSTPTSPRSRPQLPEDALPLHMRQRSLVCDATGPVLDNLDPGVFLHASASHDGAAVLGLTAPAGATDFLDLTLGKLAAGRMLVCARSKLWWMTPEWRTSTRTLPPEIQFLLVELQPGGQGPYALLLPLIDGDFRATLRPAKSKDASREGEVVLRVESGDERVTSEKWRSLLHVSVGWDPYTLVDRGVAAAAKMSGGAGPLSAKQLPPSLDAFGWCTWDAFYSSVSAKGIQEGLRSLHQNGIRPRLLIIDDGWQMTELDPPGTQHVPLTPTELAERLAWLDEDERALLRDTQEEFFKESMEVLAETAVKMPAGTSASTSMPLLSSLGPEAAKVASHPHVHTHPPPPQPAVGAAATSQATVTSLDAVPDFDVPKEEGNGVSGGAQAGRKPDVQQPAGNDAPAKLPAGEGEKKAAAENPAALMVARLGQKLAGWVVGLGTAAFLLGYQWLVEPAPPGSLPVRAFAALANGPLRGAMLGFYSGASDFTRRLISVKANAKFSSPDAGPDEPWDGKPENLKSVVDHIRHKWGVRYVYCWHGLPAYWAGIMPGYPEVAKYGATVMYARPTPGVLEVEPSMAWNPAVLAGVGVLADPTPVYNDMHSYLASAGVDGVKVDCQAGVGLVGSALGGGPALSRRFHAALEDSITQHFQRNHAINCMCHSTENLYRMRDTAVARASDDFYPRDPASSQPHIAACAYNSVFLSALVQPDWDMFHSKHPAARIHAIARVVSGASIYVSDKPGEHDIGLLRQLVLPNGMVLRCAGPGRPTRDCLFNDVLRDGRSALKVCNVNRGGPNAAPGARPLNGVIAAFNLQGSSWDRERRKFYVHDPTPALVEAQVRPKDVEAFSALPAGAASTFVAHVHGQPAGSLHQLGWSTVLSVRLPAATGELITLAPVVQAGDLSFACIGLMNMMNSGGAVTSLNLSPGAAALTPSGNGLSAASMASTDTGLTPTLASAAVGVRGAGTLLCYTSRRPRGVRVCGVPLLVDYREESGALCVEVPPTVDLAAQVHIEW